MKNFRFLSILTLVIVVIMVIASNLIVPTKSVRGKSGALPLANDPSPEQLLAQDLALSDARVQSYTVGSRSEVFGVRSVGAQYAESSAACETAVCYQVELYNFDENAAVIAIVDTDAAEVLDVYYMPNTHPGINRRLADLATRIAINHPDVIEALGFRPTEVSMAPVDGGLVDSACLTHLCVAPTFEVGERNLWAIVDLTDEKLLHVAWTELQPNLPNGSVHYTAPYGCTTPGTVTRDGWDLAYEVTPTDGLRVYNASFNGVPALTSVKLVEWHAAYADNSWGFEDYTGCGGGGGGFPISPYGETQIIDIQDGFDVIGFEVVQDFRMSNWGNNCNYRYEQHIQFYDDGRFRVVAGAFGRDCGGGGATYRPVVRIDVAVNGDDNDTLASWDGSNWVAESTEFWANQPHTFTVAPWRITDQTGEGYYIEPGVGQYDDGGLGDNAYFYAVAHHANEGDTDMPIIGDCCATGGDYQQGPHLYLNDEPLTDTNIVLWYVSQSNATSVAGNEYCWTVTGEPNPETYPCFTGPMFVPITDTVNTAVASFIHNGPLTLGETAVFTNTTTGSHPITYTWGFGDGATSSEVAPTHAYTATGVYTVTLLAENEGGSSTYSEAVHVGAESVTITPRSAGTLTYTNPTGEVISVTVPPSSVNNVVTLLLTPQETAVPPAGMRFVGNAFSLEAFDSNGEWLPNFAFSHSISIFLAYNEANLTGLSESSLSLMRQSAVGWSDAAETCSPPTPPILNTDENQLEVAVCSTGSYALFAPPVSYLYLPAIVWQQP
ncbi:MAG: PKD domain-containing protein [Ardenticatenaceae bacterium]|nr:PKD domain-containing protein [Anaerolineales bacterium]MCB8922642.1 PKD domain-containing protein [Ardenticatenaceae bacterium]MCB9003650.1 PKD domain-containing protein [Ardenticatenaceae bacterium]